MLKLFQTGLFLLLNLLIEIIFWLSKPILKIILKRIDYQDALRVSGSSTQGGIMIHAASLGEVNAVSSLVRELCWHVSPDRILITTTTVAGRNAAASLHPQLQVRLSVLDVSSLRKKQLETFAPGLICIVETEIWPNLLYRAGQRKIPILFLNARLGQLSQKRLHRLKPLLARIGSSIQEILAKSEDDATRFRQLFNVPVKVAGNLKFALKPPDYDQVQVKRDLGYSDEDIIICAGSTRPGEENLLMRAFFELRGQHPNLKLIIAPRHIQRVEEVKRFCGATGFHLYSQLDGKPASDPVLIIDQLGYLNKAYSICTVAIVGGSLFDFGGHNPLEPAFYEKAILIGPYHDSCRESVHELAKADAIVVCERQHLNKRLASLLSDPAEMSAMGSRAKDVITRFQTSLDEHLKEILNWIN